MSEDDAVEIGIERACEAVLALPMGQRAWDKKEYMIAETAARTAVNAYGEPSEADVERVAEAMCRRRNTGQCAAICLSRFSISQCTHQMSVWGQDARAAIAAMQGGRK